MYFFNPVNNSKKITKIRKDKKNDWKLHSLSNNFAYGRNHSKETKMYFDRQ